MHKLFRRKPLFLLAACLLGASSPGWSQQNTSIPETVTQPELERHIRFLASDEMQGRDTGSPELAIAARYLAEFFRAHGIEPVEGSDSYFQEVPLRITSGPTEGSLKIGKNNYALKEDFLLMAGKDTTISAPIIYLDYGSKEDIEKADVKGKVVVVKAGMPGESSPQAWIYSAREKRDLLSKKGASAVVELYNSPQIPWRILVNYLSGEQWKLQEQSGTAASIPHIWLKDLDNSKLAQFAEMKKASASLNIRGKEDKPVKSQNVLAVIEGTDPELKDEYLLLSAHYDHVGIKEGTNDADTIFNGARDNAIGTASIMMAAKYLAENPPKRSVLIAAWTAEEKGLLGSSWYAENPLIPLDKTVYNLNIDGAGYNDTTKVTVIGLERTAAEEELIMAAQTFGLEAIQDPVPEQNLFDRSDNVNFATKGVPAPTFSPGVTAFNEELMKYYHQVTDNPESLNYHYITNYARAFTLAAEKIANAAEAPFWTAGDKYEAAGKQLYQK